MSSHWKSDFEPDRSGAVATFRNPSPWLISQLGADEAEYCVDAGHPERDPEHREQFQTQPLAPSVRRGFGERGVAVLHRISLARHTPESA